MMRDAWGSFADTPEDFAGEIAAALEEREARCEHKRLRGLLKFWNAQGRPLLFFDLASDPRGALVEMHKTPRGYWLPFIMRGASNGVMSETA